MFVATMAGQSYDFISDIKSIQTFYWNYLNQNVC